MAVSTDPGRIVAMGFDAFADAVREQLPRWGGTRRNLRVLRAIFDAAHAPGGVETERAAACERAAYALADWHYALDQVTDVEHRMVEVLDALDLNELVTTITGLSVVGAAAILAETGDPARFDCARTWAKHAGLCPRANESAPFQGSTKVSRRGRPGLRLAAWRALWAALRHNPVYAARYTHLTTRALTTRSATGRPARPSPPHCFGSCSSWSPDVSPGTRPSPPERGGVAGCLARHWSRAGPTRLPFG